MTRTSLGWVKTPLLSCLSFSAAMRSWQSLLDVCTALKTSGVTLKRLASPSKRLKNETMCLMPWTVCIAHWALSLRCRQFLLKPISPTAFLCGMHSNAFTSQAKRGNLVLLLASFFSKLCCQYSLIRVDGSDQHVQAGRACIHPSKSIHRLDHLQHPKMSSRGLFFPQLWA